MERMNKRTGKMVMFGALATLILFGTAYADDQLWREAPNYPNAAAYTSDDDVAFDSSANIASDKPWRVTPTYPGASAYTFDEAGSPTISGIVNPDSKFVDDRGRTLNLSNTDEGMQVQSLVGQRVEIKGTVMDDGGQQKVNVTDYKILEDNIDDGGNN